MDQTTSIAIGVIAYTAWAAIFFMPFARAHAGFRKTAQQAGEWSDQWIRRPVTDEGLERQRRDLVGKFWRFFVANTIGVLALVAWLLSAINR